MSKSGYVFRTFLVSLALISVFASGASAVVTITEYPIPVSATVRDYDDITAGPDGNVWFTEFYQDRIGKITGGGTVTEYSVPTSFCGVRGITAGPDGNIWFAEYYGNKIGKSTPGGGISEYTITSGTNYPWGITAGPDGNVWFTESSKIGMIDPGGIITEYSSPGDFRQITSNGWDGALWFVNHTTNAIERITTGGIVTNYPVSSLSSINDIATGPDGALWFSFYDAGRIGRLATDGMLSFYDYPGSTLYNGRIAAGTDGALWFTDAFSNKIGRMTTFGSITEYDIPTAESYPMAITAGPGNTIWFIESAPSVNKIAKLSFSTLDINTNRTGTGSLICNPNPVTEGTDSLCSIIPSSGYYVADVSAGPAGGAVSIGPVFSYYFDNVNEVNEIDVSFVLNNVQTYLGASSANGGSFLFSEDGIHIALNQPYLIAGDWIEVPTGAYMEDISLNRTDGIIVTLSGGWNSDFSTNTGSMSVIAGNLTIEGTGSLIIDHITIQ